MSDLTPNTEPFLEDTRALFTPMISNQEADILLHTSSNGRYVSYEPLAIDLGKRGLMLDYGPQVLAGGAHYLVMTVKGREALSEWKRAQPAPKSKRRRPSPQFEAWLTYCELFRKVTLGKFVKDVWPYRNSL